MAKKTPAPESDLLIDTARTIGTALGTLTAKASSTADSLTEAAKNARMPTSDEAKAAVGSFLTKAKKAVKVAQKAMAHSKKKAKPAPKKATKKAAKKAAPKKAAPKKRK